MNNISELKVKNHDFTQACYLPLRQSEEPPIESTIPLNYLNTVRRNSKQQFVAYRCGLSTNSKHMMQNYQKITYLDSTSYVLAIAQQLVQLGVQKGDRCVIYAKNSPLWFFTDLAIASVGAVMVPIYDTLGLENIIYCLKLVQPLVIFVSEDYLQNIVGVLPQLDYHSVIISFDKLDQIRDIRQLAEAVFQQSQTFSDQKMTQQQLMEKKQQIAQLVSSTGSASSLRDIVLPTIESDKIKELETLMLNSDLTPQSLSSLVFTSGTSGHPKAVALTHSNIIAGGATMGYRFSPYSPVDRQEQGSYLSYLPLAHIFERGMQHLLMFRGFLIYYSSGNVKNLTDDIVLAKPTYFIGVPRVFQKIYDGVNAIIAKQPLINQAMFKLFHQIKSAYFYLCPNAYRHGTLKIADKLIFKQIIEKLGGNVEFVVSGSSALPKDVKKFLEICTGARVGDGYGLTENGGVMYNYCGQKMWQNTQLGFAAYQTDVKVVDTQESTEYSLQRDRIGELCVKGPALALGYYQPDGSIQSFTDDQGYYHTQDLVVVNPDGSCGFVRRQAQVAKLQQGEFVDLAAVEAALELSPLISAAFVHAQADKSFPVAIICVNKQVLEKNVGAEQMQFFSNGQDCSIVEKFVFEEGEKCVRAAKLKGFCVPRAYKILADADWTASEELYTPSLKKKYGGFRKEFANELAKLYEQSDYGMIRDNNWTNISGLCLVFSAIAIVVSIFLTKY